MGIALPKWMIETQNNGYVLGVYGLLFGIFLPWFVGSWWYGSRRITKDGALTVTADGYFKELKEDVDFERAVEILSASTEFSPKNPKGSIIKSLKNESAFANLQSKVFESMKHHRISTTFIETALKSKTAYAGKAALLLYSHMLCVPIQNISLLRGECPSSSPEQFQADLFTIDYRSNGRCGEVDFPVHLLNAYFPGPQLAFGVLDSLECAATLDSSLPS